MGDCCLLKPTTEKLASLYLVYQKGEKNALENLCKALESIMRGYFRSKFSDASLVDDLCQETYLRLLNNLPTLKEPMKLKNFVLKVSYHVLQDYYREKYHQQEKFSNIDIADDKQDTAFTENIHAHSPLANISETMDIKKALAEFSEKTRKILLLKADGYKYEEIAVMLDISESSVKMQVKRGMEKLKNLLINVTFWWFFTTYLLETIIR